MCVCVVVCVCVWGCQGVVLEEKGNGVRAHLGLLLLLQLELEVVAALELLAEGLLQLLGFALLRQQAVVQLLHLCDV